MMEYIRDLLGCYCCCVVDCLLDFRTAIMFALYTTDITQGLTIVLYHNLSTYYAASEVADHFARSPDSIYRILLLVI